MRYHVTFPPLPGPQFKAHSGKTFKLSYPCAMLNVMVAANNTNDQFAVRFMVGVGRETQLVVMTWGCWITPWSTSASWADAATPPRSPGDDVPSCRAMTTPAFPLLLNPCQVLHDDRTKEYRTESRMSIEFEVDGPYKVGTGAALLGAKRMPRLPMAQVGLRVVVTPKPPHDQTCRR